MNCSEARDRLTRQSGLRARGPRSGRVAQHLADCAACRAFARRYDAARGGLRDHLLEVEPGADFAARVVADLPRSPSLLGWAALRLLPATVALALVLTGWCLLSAPWPGELLADSPTDDPLAWVIDSEEAAP